MLIKWQGGRMSDEQRDIFVAALNAMQKTTVDQQKGAKK